MIVNWLIDVLVFLYSMTMNWLPNVEISAGTVDAATQALNSVNFLLPMDQILIVAGLWLALLIPTVIIWVIRFVKKFLPW